MKRLGNGRVFVVLSSLVIGLLLFFTNTGVREVHRPSNFNEQSLADLQPGPDDWPCWRGTDGRNRSLSSTPPLNWSASENVEWKSSVPGRGHSSPILWGERIFLSTADDEQQTVSLLCFDQSTGRTMWQTELHRGGLMLAHKKNSHASSTPACDGKSIYVTSSINGALLVTAIDFTGQIEWQRDAGPYASEWGYGSSVAMHKSLVIVSSDNRGSTVDRLMGSS